ncbi:MAG: tetratricopeptide repeat protein [Planctomycetota bacterium]|nr:MAG: tetratricopeptide repeat protein [Planctomycetota bacterium]
MSASTGGETLFGRIAVMQGFITPEQLAECIAYQAHKAPGEYIGDILQSRGYMSLDQISTVLAIQEERLLQEIDNLHRKHESIQTGKASVMVKLSEEKAISKALKARRREEKLSEEDDSFEDESDDESLLTHQLPKMKKAASLLCASCGCQVGFEDKNIERPTACPVCESPLTVSPETVSLQRDDTRVLGDDTETVPLPDRVDKQILGRYIVREKLGAGGMGVVYRAEDTVLRKEVALKLLPGGSDLSDPRVKRFYQEARAAAQLQHENIIQIHDVGTVRGRHYISMAFIDGFTLKELIEDKKLRLHESLELLERIAKALAYAHKEGIIHRDVKTANIFVSHAGRPFLGDFGLARDIRSVERITQEHTVMGTLEYMSPEQADGRNDDIGPRSDVYSLGVILYEMLTGDVPFTGESMPVIIKQILEKEPVPPRKINKSIPRDLEVICLKTMEKDPERRYQTAADFAEDINRYLAGEVIKARPASLFYRARKKIKRHKGIFGVSLSAAAVIILLLVYFLAMPSYRAWRLQKRDERIRADAKAYFNEKFEEGRRKLAELDRLPDDDKEAILSKADYINDNFVSESVLSACVERLGKRFSGAGDRVGEIASEVIKDEYSEHPILIKVNAAAGNKLQRAAEMKGNSTIPPEAVRYFAAAFRHGFPHRAPEAVTALFKLAENCLLNTMVDTARKQYIKLIKIFPDSEEATFAHFRLGNFTEARRRFARMLSNKDTEILAERMMELCGRLNPVRCLEGMDVYIARGGDLNGDGRDEIAIMPSSRDRIEIYRYNNGRFEILTSLDIKAFDEGDYVFQPNFFIKDFDGDGKGELLVFLGGQNMPKCRVRWYRLVDDKLEMISEIDKLIYTSFGYGVDAGDADNDGDRDVLMGTTAMVRQAFIFDSIENTADNKMIYKDSDVLTAKIADIDNDGKNEILLSVGPWNDYELRILRFNPDSKEYDVVGRQFFGGWNFSYVADLDSDGVPEIVCTKASGKCENPFALGPGSNNQARGGIYVFHFSDDKLKCQAKWTKPGLEPLWGWAGYGPSVSFEGKYTFSTHAANGYYGAFAITLCDKPTVREGMRVESLIYHSRERGNILPLSYLTADVDGDRDEEFVVSSGGKIYIYGLAKEKSPRLPSGPSDDTAEVEYGPFFIGDSLMEMKHYDQAIAAFENLAKSGSKEIAYHSLLRKAACLGFQEKYGEAASLCRNAGLLYPGYGKDAVLQQAWYLAEGGFWKGAQDLYEKANEEYTLSPPEQDLVENQLSWLRSITSLEEIYNFDQSAEDDKYFRSCGPLRFSVRDGKIICRTERKSNEYIVVPVRLSGGCVKSDFDVNFPVLEWDSQPFFGFFKKIEHGDSKFDAKLYVEVRVVTLYSNPNVNPRLFLYSSGRLHSSRSGVFIERGRWYNVSMVYLRSKNQIIVRVKDNSTGKTLVIMKGAPVTPLEDGDYFFGIHSLTRVGGNFVTNIEVDNLKLWASPGSELYIPECSDENEKALDLTELAGGRQVHGDYAKAEKLLSKALEISNGNCWQAFYERGILNFRTGKPEAGAKDLIEASKIDWDGFKSKITEDYNYAPDNCNLIEVMLDAAQLRPEFEVTSDPFDFWNGSIDKNDEERWLRNLIAANLYAKKSPGGPGAYYRLALSLKNTNYVRQALEVAEEWCANSPDNAAAFNLAADLYTRLFFSDKALKAIDRAIELKPDEKDYYGTKARAFGSKFDIQGTLDTYRKILKMTTGDSKEDEKRKKLLKRGIEKLERSLTPIKIELEPVPEGKK